MGLFFDEEAEVTATGGRLIHCEWCTDRFADLSSAITHVRVVHPLQFYILAALPAVEPPAAVAEPPAADEPPAFAEDEEGLHVLNVGAGTIVSDLTVAVPGVDNDVAYASAMLEQVLPTMVRTHVLEDLTAVRNWVEGQFGITDAELQVQDQFIVLSSPSLDLQVRVDLLDPVPLLFRSGELASDSRTMPVSGADVASGPGTMAVPGADTLVVPGADVVSGVGSLAVPGRADVAPGRADVAEADTDFEMAMSCCSPM